jgi:hypothetical protein
LKGLHQLNFDLIAVACYLANFSTFQQTETGGGFAEEQPKLNGKIA